MARTTVEDCAGWFSRHASRHAAIAAAGYLDGRASAAAARPAILGATAPSPPLDRAASQFRSYKLKWSIQLSPADSMRKVDEMSRREAASFFATYPRFLYKFNRGDSPRSLEGLIVSSAAWLSSPLDFNDPFDLRANVDILGSPDERIEFLARRFRRNESANLGNHPDQAKARAIQFVRSGEYLAALQGAFEKHAAQIGVACFASPSPGCTRTSGARDILMWSHYARDHKGLCFQFHTRRSPSFFVKASKVDYKDEVVKINWRDQASRLSEMYSALFRKALLWSHENEYRIALPGRANSTESFKPGALTGIIFGCRSDPKMIEDVISLCRLRRSNGYPAIRLFRSRQMGGSYRLAIGRASDLEVVANQK